MAMEAIIPAPSGEELYNQPISSELVVSVL